MEEERSWIGMASVGGKIYAIGGITGQLGQRLNLSEVYDPRTNDWRYVAPMPTARSSPGAVAVRDLIYVIGGLGDAGTSTAVEAYDPQKDAWHTGLAPLPIKRFDMGAVAIGDLIYTMGGYDLRETNTVEAYDTASNRWTALPPMPTARYALQAVVVDGKIWAMGGRNADGPSDVIEVFDPDTKQWSRSPLRLPEPLAGYGATVGGGELHVAKYDKHYAFDLRTNVWTSLPPMPTSRHGLRLAYIDGVFYAVGGCRPNGDGLADVARNEVYIASARPQPHPVEREGLTALLALVAMLIVAALLLPRMTMAGSASNTHKV
jgi:N-acetylneuraminic acid mutarotase